MIDLKERALVPTHYALKNYASVRVCLHYRFAHSAHCVLSAQSNYNLRSWAFEAAAPGSNGAAVKWYRLDSHTADSISMPKAYAVKTFGTRCPSVAGCWCLTGLSLVVQPWTRRSARTWHSASSGY